MSWMLNRWIARHEQVHHRNGVRSDNRPENLELWLVHQPAGQRVSDLLGWAHEIIATYGAVKQSPTSSLATALMGL